MATSPEPRPYSHRRNALDRLRQKLELRRILLLWRGRKRAWWRPFRSLVVLAVMLLVGLTAFAAISWWTPGEGPLRVDGGCSNNQFGCGALTEVAATVLALAFAFAVFAYWRVYRVVREHVKPWRDEPYKLIPTATPIEQVVGREGICEILEEDLVERKRRPQVVLGGIGDGKTAVLVRLAQRLVKKGAVPVGVRLRDAEKTLDFEALAMAEFMARVQGQLLSGDEGDKVWRKLYCDGRIVILADGLEEALIGHEGREAVIRRALDRAAEMKVPLVVASRPEAALAGADAAVIRLEPLPTRNAIDYVRDVTRDEAAAEADDTADVPKLASVAEIADRPLFLALARESYRRGRLSAIPLTNRLDAQLKLLEDWEARLLDEDERYPRLRADAREETLEGAETIACVAIAENRLELSFDKLKRSPYANHDEEQDRNVARGAEHLGLVELTAGGVRFTHSITQAYLAAQQLPSRIGRHRDRVRSGINERLPGVWRVTGRDYLTDVLDEPSREALMALVICCRLHATPAIRASLQARLRRLATSPRLARKPAAFDVLAAAYEIDWMRRGAGSAELGSTARRLWSHGGRQASGEELRESKVRAVLRMAQDGTIHAYGALWAACVRESDYRVRFRAAQELASGGDKAFEVIEPGEVLRGCGPRLTYEAQPSRLRAADVRRGYLQGWTLPLLVRSCEASADRAAEALEGWIHLADPARTGGPTLHLGVESSLAQGFRLEANRIHPGARDQQLVDLAGELLEKAQWWYSRLVLLHALCLWSLRVTSGQREQLRRRIWHHAAHDAHPFVRAAARLCLEALNADEKASFLEQLIARRELVDTRLPRARSLRLEQRAKKARWRGPAHYIWIDEVGVTAKVGPRTPLWEPTSPTGLWISLDAGWRGLAPRARQLVADVLVDLNLVEGEAEPPRHRGNQDRNGSLPAADADRLVLNREIRRRKGAGERLPACLVHARARARLGVYRPEDTRDKGERECPPRCGLKLCPYPAQARDPFRANLSETFCREQLRLLGGRWKDFPRRWELQGPAWRFLRRMRAIPEWQNDASRWRIWSRRAERKALEEFWKGMEARDQR
jgi:hypothetical protein